MKSRINRHLCINSPYNWKQPTKLHSIPHLTRHYLDHRTSRNEAFIRDYVKCISFRDDCNWISFVPGKTFTTLSETICQVISCKCNSDTPLIKVTFRAGCHAGCQEVSRCHTRGEPEESIVRRWQSTQVRDPSWLWNPGQTSPEIQNRGNSGPQKGLLHKKLFEL